MRLVSIGITTYNSKEYLEKCLQSIQDNVHITHEVVVFDDGSSDGTAEMVRTRFPDVLLIRGETNQGTIHGRTVVWHKSVGDYFVRLDVDTEVYSQCMETLATFLDEHPQIGVVAPQIVYPDGIPDYTSYGVSRIGVLRTFLDYSFIVWKGLRKLISIFGMKPQLPARPIQVDHVLGAAFMVRRQAGFEAGLPDPNIRHFREETDWLYSMKAKGWGVWYHPQAVVMHHGGSSTTALAPIYIHGSPSRLEDMWYFIHKWYPGVWKNVLFWVAIVFGSLLSITAGIVLVPAGIFSSKARLVVTRIFRTFGGVVWWHIVNDQYLLIPRNYLKTHSRNEKNSKK